MNHPSALRSKMRNILLTTTGLCMAGVMMPDTASAAPRYDRIAGGYSIDIGNHVFDYDVIVENPGSSLTGHMIDIRNGAEMLITDRGVAGFQYLTVGGDGDSGSATVSNGGALYVYDSLVFASGSNGYGSLIVEGAGSQVNVAGRMDFDGYDFSLGRYHPA